MTRKAVTSTYTTKTSSLLLSFVIVWSTALVTDAFTCQSYHHDNQYHHSNKESYDIKQIVLIPRNVKHLSSEMLGSTMSEYILYPVTSFLQRGPGTVFHQLGNAHGLSFKSTNEV